MADKDLPLQCDITSDVTLGAGHKNTNKIMVRLVNTANESVQFSGRGANGTLSLTISVGTQASALVATAEDSSDIKIDSPDKWTQSYNYNNDQATWSFSLPEVVLTPHEETRLTLTKFECNTDPGTAQLIIRVAITDYNNYEKTLDVEKKATEVLQILYFTATSPQIITEKDKKAFALEWNTLQADKVVLYKANNLLKTFQEGAKEGAMVFKNGEKFSYQEEKPSLTTTYKLVATDGTTQQEKELTVQVLQPGWYRVDDFRRRFGYPSVLCNLDNVRLYGIFVNQGQAFLCSSAYPVAVWELVNTVVPENMATSPAVYFANQLWLVGGSTADPRNVSNQIWSYTPEGGAWSPQQKPPWSPRMGHACVVFQQRVWVVGGMDANGNALDEVWSCDRQSKWTRHSHRAWSPRCMHAATVFQNKIWIYGGVTAPFGDPLEDLWTSGDGTTWERYKTIPHDAGNPIGKPLGCTLQVVKGKLHLLGSFRRGTTLRSRQFILEAAQETWDVGEIPPEKSWDLQRGNTFSLLSTEYKGLVFLRSLNYQTADNPTSLQVYVP